MRKHREIGRRPLDVLQRRSGIGLRLRGFESLEDRRLLATNIAIHAAGATGTEMMQLRIDGTAVADWAVTRVLTDARQFDAFTFTSPGDVTIDQIRVAFTNDGVSGDGADRNLFVDGVTVDGVKYESESPAVYSTGTWDSGINGLLPGYRQTEALHYDGYFQYASGGTVIEIFAAGQTGEEQMELLIAGQTVAAFSNVGGDAAAGQHQSYTYVHPGSIAIGDVRIAFVNDSYDGALDRNLRVDALSVGGVRYETESPTVYSTGTWIEGEGVTPGFKQSEWLHTNGYFQFDEPVGAGSAIEIRAAGATGEEGLALVIAGQVAATFSRIGGDAQVGVFQSFHYQHPTIVDASDIAIRFINDGVSAEGADRNLRIDGLRLDGAFQEAEAVDVYSTGTWIEGIGIRPGLWQSEYLHTNGELQFASSAVPGVLALGTSLASVGESAGTVSLPVVRSGGSDGTVALRYTTVDATATAGADYASQAGYVIFGPGETTKAIVIPIIGEAVDEMNETFNVAVDYALGGATVNQPRTATVTIVDDDGAPTAGSGNGLLGAYFNDQNLSTPLFERTDATIDFNWAGGSPASSIAADTFSVRWTGKIEPLYSQVHQFRVTADDGVRLWINGQLLIDQWNDHPATDYYGSITLAAGFKYDLRIEYYENTGNAVMKLAWSSGGQPFQAVPRSQLYSDPPTPTQNGTFSGQTIVAGLVGPTAIDFDSTGRMFIAEQQGVVRVFQNGQLRGAPFLDIRSRVNYVQDRGMLGVAVHPNFPATPYVYVAYTYDPPETLSRTGLAGPDGSGNRVARVSRFTADAATGFNTAIAGSEVVLVGSNSTWANISRPDLDSTDNMSLPPSGGMNGEMRDILIADSRSHTVGNLAFGSDGMLYIANGDGTSFGRVDERTIRVQSIDSLSGKLLRVDPLSGEGLPDNPFYNGDPGANRSKVYDYGLRNPFRFALHPGTGVPYIGDVGWNTYEELNAGRGQNFGWPYYEGAGGISLQTGGYRDLPQAQAFYASGAAVTAPLWARAHADGAVAIVAGDFYAGAVYPSSYHHALFISDFGDLQLRVVRLAAGGGVASVTPLNLSVGAVVEMTMGRDGYMYYVDLTGRVGRLVFTPASASLSAAGADFDADGAVDGADFLAWQRGYGRSEGALTAEGDATGDGAVTSDDLHAWMSEMPQTFDLPQPALDEAIAWVAVSAEADEPPAALRVEPPAAEMEQRPRYRPAALAPPPALASASSTQASAARAADAVFENWEEHPLGVGRAL